MSRISACLALLLLAFAAEAAGAGPDITSGTWHLGLKGLFGKGVRRGTPFTKDLDIYPVFENGKMVNALATARQYNTSIHFV